MLQWISSNSCPLNLLLVRSHQAEIMIAMRLIQRPSNVTRVRVEPRSFNQGCRKNNAFSHSAMPPLSIPSCCYLASSITSHCKIRKFESMSNTRLVSSAEPEICNGGGGYLSEVCYVSGSVTRKILFFCKNDLILGLF